MANSVEQNRYGPFWVLGNIVVATPGTPVSVMSLVDPQGNNDPNNATRTVSSEYSEGRSQQMTFQGVNQAAGGGHGLGPNTGNVYIIKRGANAGGSGNRDDSGVIIGVLFPGGGYGFGSAPLVLDVFNPYDILIDADNANDAAQVTLIIQ